MKGRASRRAAGLSETARGTARGEAVLQRPMGAEERGSPAEEEVLFLCFRVGEERYLLDVATVKEVSRVQRLTSVPRAPAGIAGVIDLRGTFIPVVDVRPRLGGGDTAVDPRSSRIVVVGVGGRVAGLLVDALHPVVRFPVAQIHPPPVLALPEGAGCISGLCARAGEAFLVIDAGRLLASGMERTAAPGAA